MRCEWNMSPNLCNAMKVSLHLDCIYRCSQCNESKLYAVHSAAGCVNPSTVHATKAQDLKHKGGCSGYCL